MKAIEPIIGMTVLLPCLALAAGKHAIQVDPTIARPGDPGTSCIVVEGAGYARLELKQTVPLAFTASEAFEVGIDLG